MKSSKNYFGLVLLFTTFFAQALRAQDAEADEDFVQWSLSQDSSNGKEAQLLLSAKIQKGYHLYALKNSDIEPAATTLKISSLNKIKSVHAYQRTPREIKNPDLGISSFVFENKAEFPLIVSFEDSALNSSKLSVAVRYSVCSDRVCFPPVVKTLDSKIDFGGMDKAFAGRIQKSFHESAQSLKIEESQIPTGSPSEKSASLPVSGLSFSFLLLAFGLGLASVLTPCVFPMLPITVSFFLRQNTDSTKGRLKHILLFGAGIVGFFCGIGMLVTLIKGPFALVQLASNPWMNLAIGVLLLALALSLLGLWEMSLPHSLLLKISPANNNLSAGGILLMGLTLSISSFACIGPFMGTLLASTLASQDIWKPAIGMGAYSLGLAAPFVLMATFPTLLKRLPRSGNWLNSVKIVFGVLVLLFSVKYFNNARSTFFASAQNLASSESCKSVWKNNQSAALEDAKKNNQNIFLSFSGYNCTNCHWMKSNILSREKIKSSVDGLVVSELYTDGTDSASTENQKVELTRFGTVALPFYAILDSNNEVLATFSGLTKSEDEFLNFLKKGEKLEVASNPRKYERDAKCLTN